MKYTKMNLYIVITEQTKVQRSNYNEKRNKLAIDIYHLAYSRNGGEIARYYEAVGAYYSFVKYISYTKGVDFTKSHRK
jgi:hypothetical protein